MQGFKEKPEKVIGGMVMNKTEFVGSSADKTLRNEAIKGVNAQYDPEKREAATQMVEKELAIVKDQGTAPQYLILLNALKETGAKSEEFCIRGAAASSILVHVLGFSRVDPLTVEPRLYSEFFFDITGSKFTPFELNVTTDLHERIRKYFENYPGEERITPKYDHDKLIGFYLGDPLTDSYTGEPFYPYYINIIPVEDPNGFGESLLSGDIYDTITPKNLPEYIKCLEFKLDIDAWEENAETLFKEGKAPLNDLIADREDVYEYMLDHGVEKEMAFRIAEHVRKGKALSKGWNQDMIDAMNKVSIPEWYRKSCEKIRYLFPRAHAMSFIDCYCKDVV
ncbi:MAG: hypothetical protein E7298_06250 [Lachnospiraceae bacterium]|nr:hypothetical protein [Lachnospiraceae bacterium]